MKIKYLSRGVAIILNNENICLLSHDLRSIITLILLSFIVRIVY